MARKTPLRTYRVVLPDGIRWEHLPRTLTTVAATNHRKALQFARKQLGTTTLPRGTKVIPLGWGKR